MNAPAPHLAAIPLPAQISLPTNIRYWDDFALEQRSIRDLETEDVWQLVTDARKISLDFSKPDDAHRNIFKLWVVDLLLSISARSTCTYYHQLIALGCQAITDLTNRLITDHPSDFRDFWLTEFLPEIDVNQVRAAKSLCRTFCRHGFGHWRIEMLDFVSKLPGHALDKYAVVQRGECFVDLHDQSRMAQHLDDLAQHITDGGTRIETDTLRGAAILILAFQHGLRAGQIARIKKASVIVFPTGAIHIKFPVTKQRLASSGQESVRSIKREWCSIFAELRRRKDLAPDSVYFVGCEPGTVKDSFKKLLSRVTVNDWTLTDLRHTSAQRMVDAGCSHQVITEFMSHADTATALVYIKGSPTQAQRINQALGMSDIFSVVANLAQTGVITKTDLNEIPPDHIVSGVPHGVPVCGLGACTAKQSLCSRNPVISCYTCHKFLAVSDISVHENVIVGLRKVVLAFAEMARPGETSPAMAQLRPTLEAAQSLVDQLKQGGV